MDIQHDFDFLKRLAKGLADQFGNNCEVVLHDLRNGHENTIVAIENGHITKRKAGDGASEVVLQALKQDEKPRDHFNYLTKTKDGKVLKSTTVHLLDDDGKAVGIFGINYDVTELLRAEQALKALTAVKDAGDPKNEIETIPGNVQELLDNLIDEACRHVGKEVSAMDKSDKVRAIQYLDEKGAFLIKKSAEKVSNHFGISKFTLYNYLGEGK